MSEGERFVKLPVSILARRDVGAVAKLVYASIRDRVGDNGAAWPGVRRLAIDTGASVNAVLRGLHELTEARLAAVDGVGPRGSHKYTVASAAEMEALPIRKRCRNEDTGAAETETLALPKRRHNQTHIQTHIQTKGESPCADRPRDLLWDAVCEVFALTPATKADRTRVGRVVRDLKAKGGDPDELRKRVARYRAEWPSCECTPEAVLKHWQRFATERKPADRAGRPDLASDDRYRKLLAT